MTIATQKIEAKKNVRKTLEQRKQAAIKALADIKAKENQEKRDKDRDIKILFGAYYVKLYRENANYRDKITKTLEDFFSSKDNDIKRFSAFRDEIMAQEKAKQYDQNKFLFDFPTDIPDDIRIAALKLLGAKWDIKAKSYVAPPGTTDDMIMQAIASAPHQIAADKQAHKDEIARRAAERKAKATKAKQ